MRETAAESNPNGWTPRYRPQPKLADELDSLCEDERQKTSAPTRRIYIVKRLTLTLQDNRWCDLRDKTLYLYPHGFGLDDIDLVSVAAPHLVVDYSHAADGVVGAAQIQEVVVG